MTRIDRDTVHVLHNCGPSVSSVYRTGAVGVEWVIAPAMLVMHLLAAADIAGIESDVFAGAHGAQLHPVLVEAAACAVLVRIGDVTGRDITTSLPDLVPMLQAGRKALGKVSRRATERACERVTEVRDLLPALGEGTRFWGVAKWSQTGAAQKLTSGDGSPEARLADARRAAVSLTLIAYATPPIVLPSRDASLHYFQRSGALTMRWFGSGGVA